MLMDIIRPIICCQIFKRSSRDSFTLTITVALREGSILLLLHVLFLSIIVVVVVVTLCYIILCYVYTDRQTDIRTDRRTCLLWLYQRLRSLQCDRAGNHSS